MINVKDKIIVRNPKLFMSNPELYSKTWMRASLEVPSDTCTLFKSPKAHVKSNS
jgi:hypothetical protein